MPRHTAPHGDERLPSRLTQRAPRVPGDAPHPGFAGSRVLDDPTDNALRPISTPEPPRGLEPGDASLSLPLGASLARAHGRDPRHADDMSASHALGARGDGDRPAHAHANTLDGPAGA